MERPLAESRKANEKNDVKESAMREPILAAAVQLFGKKGFASTSMQEIADAVGLSRPALYYHFTSKDEILTSLVEEVTIRSERETSRIISTADKDRVETLRAMVRAHALSILRHRKHFAVLQRDESSLPARIRAVQDRGKRKLLDTFRASIEEGIASGAFRSVDPAVSALCIFGMCSWTVQWFKPGGRLSEEQAADAIADLAVAMLRRPAQHDGDRGDAGAWLSVLKDDIAHLERALAARKPR
jgi:AcrR family transcriptional regulator